MFVVLGAGAAAIASVVPKATQTEIAGFFLVVIGLAFVGLLPWPERAVAPGLLHARAPRRLGRAPRRRVRGLRRAVHRHGARLDPRARELDRGRSRGRSCSCFAYSLGLGAAFLLAGVAFAHAMRAFRWVRSHYQLLRVASGITLVVLGLLLFFHRDWWLRVALDQLFSKIGLGTY